MGLQSAACTCRLELWDRQGFHTLICDGTIITLNLAHANANLVSQEVVRAKRSHVHVTTNGNKLGPG